MKQRIQPLLMAAALFAAGLCVTPRASLAAENDPTSIAQRIAPLASARVILRIDVARVDAARLSDEVVAKLTPPAAYKAIREQVIELASLLKANDANELFIAFRITDMPKPGPIIAIPVKASAVAKVRSGMAKAFPVGEVNVVEWGGAKVLVLGEAEAVDGLDAWDQETTVAVEHLTAGLKTIAKHPIQVFFRLSPDDRRVVREIFHVLPEEIGAGSVDELVGGFQWLAVGASLPPKASADAVFQYENEAASVRTRERMKKVVELLATNEQLKKSWPPVGKLVAAIQPEAKGDRLEMRWSEGSRKLNSLLSAFTMPLERARTAQRRAEAFNDLKQIALAMHNHFDVFRKFPAVGSRDENGRKLLSWRVHLLPFLEERELYEKFKMDEPWDSENNKKLIPEMPKVFLTPGSKLKLAQGRSTYRVPSSAKTVFPPDGDAKTFREILDGTSNTILAIEVDDDHSVIWTKPEGLKIDSARPHAGIGGHFADIFVFAMCDGSAHAVKRSITAEMLNRLFECADNNVVKLPN